MAEYELDSHGFATLLTACECLDRLRQAQAEIEKHGLTILAPTGFRRPNPGLQIEREARTGFLQAWRLLERVIHNPNNQRIDLEDPMAKLLASASR